MKTGTFASSADSTDGHSNVNATSEEEHPEESNTQNEVRVNQIIRRMRIHIWTGTLIGFAIALAIGAAFIAVVRVYCLPL